jgi:dihydrofolate reductase
MGLANDQARKTGRIVRMELSAYLAVSLDGFIARADGSMDWLRGGGPRPAEEAQRYQTFMQSVDAVAMGRATFETVRAATVWPYGTTPVVVLSGSALDVPDTLTSMVERSHGTPDQLVAQWHARGWTHVHVDGGVTIQRFLAAGRLRRLVLNRVPVLIGAGRPLCGVLPTDLWLDHVGTTTYPGGLVQSEYLVRRAGS